MQKQTHYNVNGALRSVGGPRAITREIRERVLKRLQALCTLMKEVVAAEHPNFEVISCFGVFDVASFPQETVQKVLQRGGGHEDKFD